MKKLTQLFFIGLSLFSLSGFKANAQVVINEIHYNPDVKTEPVEFVEIFNSGTNSVDLSGWSIADAIQYTFPAGTIIAPHDYKVVAQNPARLQSKFGYSGALGPYSGNLSKYGEKITLRNASGDVIDEVDYKCGFPWPIVGEPPGYSIELINPYLDNNLGGSWRISVASGYSPSASTVLIQTNSVWKYYKGTNEPSAQPGAWRQLNFNDSNWLSGATPIGYDPSISMATPLTDMNGNYTCVYLRKIFTVSDPLTVTTLFIDAMYDDGFKVWINGVNVANINMDTNEVPYTGTANIDREYANYYTYTIQSASRYLVAGTNIIAIQAANAALYDNPDFYIDIRLRSQSGVSTVGPTPGKINAAYTTNPPPQIRQVEHNPEQPPANVPVLITAKITDPDGVTNVFLEYQIVNPGSYIDILDPAFTNSASWIKVQMNDSGIGGDATANDNIYTVTIPASVQQHRRLIRYKITATDALGATVRVPYPEDPQPNFAYFVYNGVPEWRGAIQPGAAGTNGVVITVPSNSMARLPVYHLITKKTSTEYATGWAMAGSSGGISNRYTGDIYFWPGTLVYDGKVYDHIHFRARGGVWRYSMVKNMWKIDMNRGHDFEARDNWGRKFKVPWTKLNLGACIQQGDYDHRGEQGMFEAVGFRLFQLAGVPAPNTIFVSFRIIDEALEADPSTQYEGDFWGLYLAVEQENNRFLEEHDLPDSNLYKMESGTGTLNNLGPNGPTDKSDLNYILNNYSSATDAWWRTNWYLPGYYSYQAIVQAIHHYDICYNKNYFYYYHPEMRLWMIIPWDLDLTWAHNMYDSNCGGIDNIASRLFNATAVAGTGANSGTRNMQLGGTRPLIELEFKNRVREIRDLLFNRDQTWRLIDEYAAIARGPTNIPSIIDADRMMWDYNPKMANSAYTPHLNKAGQGRFYQFPRESATNSTLRGSFDATIRIMKNYVDIRSEYLDSLCNDPMIPNQPAITYTGPAGYPLNKLTFRSSNFSTPSPTNTFGYIKWRVGEVSAPDEPLIGRTEPLKYEIEAVWESPRIAPFSADITIPPDKVRTGRRYRVRVQHIDNYGRASKWSAPIEFVVGQPDSAGLVKQYLRITEIMYQPPAGGYEYVELKNISSDVTLDLAGVKFTQGIDYTFGAGVVLAPGEYIIVANAPPDNNFAAFRAFYGVDSLVKIVGPFTSGSLANEGEQIVLRTAAGGEDIVNFTYGTSRGWPDAANGAGHSLVFNEFYLDAQGSSAGEYAGNWTASAYLKGSPGRPDPVLPLQQVVLNEIAINPDINNPDPTKNWIELYNPSDTAIVLDNNWYLSDNRLALAKWRIPPGTVIPARGFVWFDENTGFNPTNGGFSLSAAGGLIYLSYLPGNSQDRIVDVARFKSMESSQSYGRYPDGSQYWSTLTTRTKGTANSAPLQRLMITEIHFHPPDFSGGIDNTVDEFVELYNPLPTPLYLTEQWRFDGGLGFSFPSNLVIQPNSYLLVVNFEPTNIAQLNAFRLAHGITDTNLIILGPYSGKLANDSERVALEYQIMLDPANQLTGWVVADEVLYADRSPWPCGADGSGNSIQRISLTKHGSDPENWNAQLPTPGAERTPIPPGLPQIVSPPKSRLVPTNGNVSFSVSLCGSPPYTYQWLFNGSVIPGETNAILNLYNVKLSDSGYYSVIVGNSAGSITSAPAQLIVQLPPYIISHPQSLIATGYTTVVMSVSAGGTEPIFYQWQFNGSAIPGATNATLMLTNVQKSQEGVYNVVVYNTAASVVSSNATLTLRMPPFITENPESVTNRAGQTKVFTVVATGDPPLYYQWRFNGVDIPGANSTNLVLTNLTAEMEGEYTVLVANQYGFAVSAPARLTVLVRPYIISQPTPSKLTVPVGSTVSFTISAGGTLPITYRWRRGGTYIADFTLYSDTCTFTLTNVQVSDSGNYYVALTNIAGNALGLSAPAVLTVLYPPAITNQPKSVPFNAGSNITFSVGATGGAPLSYQWYFNITNLVVGATNAILTITNASIANIGAYSVVVSNPVGVVTSEFAYLNMPGAPAITRQPQGITVIKGQTATFSVIAEGSQPLYYQWLFNNSVLPGANSDTFRIASAQTSDEGIYRVVVTNQYGLVISDPATLAISNPANLEIITQPLDVYAPLGSNVILQVVAAGVEPLSYRWYFNQTNLIIGANSPLLVITNAQIADTGDYFVVVNDALGSITSRIAKVVIMNPVSITLQPESLLVKAGENAIFSANATGSAPITFQWFKDNALLSGQTNLSLVIQNVNGSDTGQYTFVASNPVSSATSVVAVLTVDLTVQIISARMESDGLSLQMRGPSGIIYNVDASHNMINWERIFSGIATNGLLNFKDRQAVNKSIRFYRVIPQP